MDTLPKGYTHGTHRMIAPEDTLANIAPHLATFGITRCADVTGLDRIGFPVYCAIRPCNRSVQVSNGKGLRHVDAKVSALMEAIEVFHAERPSGALERGSLKSMRRRHRSRRVLSPVVLPDYLPDNFFSADFRLDWVKAERLGADEEVWLPASAAYLCEPILHHWSSNGLASGNHLVEATLHALYEVIERDAVSRLSSNGQVTLGPGRCRFIDLETVPHGPIRELRARLRSADVKLVLIWLKSCISLHTFMAVLLDRSPFGQATTVNIGYGTHLSVSVAAIRAITEAAQSRVVHIHGSREDLIAAAYEEPHHRLYAFFDRIKGTTPWNALRERAGNDLLEDYDFVLGRLARAGYVNIFRLNMTRAPFEIPIVKVWVCGLKLNPNLF